jgi:hypothetical protein
MAVAFEPKFGYVEVRRSRNGYAIGGSCQGLAIQAMTDLNLGFIDLDLVFDFATVAASLDFHRAPPVRGTPQALFPIRIKFQSEPRAPKL